MPQGPVSVKKKGVHQQFMLFYSGWGLLHFILIHPPFFSILFPHPFFGHLLVICKIRRSLAPLSFCRAWYVSQVSSGWPGPLHLKQLSCWHLIQRHSFGPRAEWSCPQVQDSWPPDIRPQHQRKFGSWERALFVTNSLYARNVSRGVKAWTSFPSSSSSQLGVGHLIYSQRPPVICATNISVKHSEHTFGSWVHFALGGRFGASDKGVSTMHTGHSNILWDSSKAKYLIVD